MKEWFGTLARLVVGGVWLAAGLLKVPTARRACEPCGPTTCCPSRSCRPSGTGCPPSRSSSALALVVGALTRWVAVLSALLQVAFIIGIASAWARGLQIECGCFGGGGFDADATSKYPWEIARDTGLLLLSLWLVWRPRTRLALDTFIFRPLTAPPERLDHDDEQAHVHR